jgi:glycosyltransferase involved in cell wall biosynthesis
MRLAVFTSLFPGRINTFFARDMAALGASGIELDVFPLYPLDAGMWRYVPDILNDRVLPRSRVHHISVWRAIHPRGLTRTRRVARFLRDSGAIRKSAIRYGLKPVVKSEYTFLKAWAWAQDCGDRYDHVLAYWGNYSASCAYLFHRQMARRVPFSMILHAGTDLYRDQVFLREKLLYADNVFVVCDFNRRFIQTQYPEIYGRLERKIHLHHLGLDLAEFPVRLEGRRPRTILAVGSLERIKGFDYLIEAVAHLVARGVDLELELVGSGPEQERLVELTVRLGVASRVAFRGFLDFADVRRAMTEATMLVHASPGLGDAVPTVIKEAMALGTPVVATDVAGIPELVDGGRCGVLVPPKDIRALADGIARLLDDPTLRRRNALAGRRHVEDRFDLWRNGANLAVRLKGATQPDSNYVVRSERVS